MRVRRMRETDGSETNFVPLWADHLNSQLNLNSQYRDALRAQRAQVAALARWRSPAWLRAVEWARSAAGKQAPTHQKQKQP